MFSLWNFFEELAAITKLRDHVDFTVVLIDLVQANYIGVNELLEDLNLIRQASPLCRVKLEFVDDLYCSRLSIRF